MEEIFKAKEIWFRQHPPDLGEKESMMDALFLQYSQRESCSNDTIRNLFAQLREQVKLPPEEYDAVFYIVCDLCLEHGRLAFREGAKTAIRFLREVFE